MLKALVLICSVSTPQSDCTEATALDIVRTDGGKTVAMCGFFGQSSIAGTAIRPEAGKTYEKIVCTRAHEAKR